MGQTITLCSTDSRRSLLAAISTTTEDQLWGALRSLDENILLLNHLGDHFAEANDPKLAAVYYQHANATTSQSQHIRQALAQHELLTPARLQQQAEALDDQGATYDQSG